MNLSRAMTLSLDMHKSIFLQYYVFCCQRALVLTTIFTFFVSLEARRYAFQLYSEFKDGAGLPFLRETTDVPAKLLANNLTGVQSDSRATSLLDPIVCRVRADLCKRFENLALILLVNAMAIVFHNHGEERRGFSIVPRPVFESCAGNAYLHSASWRVELASVFEHVEQDLLVLGHVAQELGITEAILFVCCKYFHLLLPAEKLDNLGHRLSRLL